MVRKLIGHELKSVGIVGFAAVLGLSGCATDPYTGEQKASKSAIGAVAGAVLGAATSSKSDRGKGALIGAAVGGGAGYYFDHQEKMLRAELQGTGVSVSRTEDRIVLNMPGNLTFNTDSSDIQASFFSVLNSVAKVFKEYKNTNIRVSGHTDSSGSEVYNQRLSEKRASSVADYLMAQGLIPARFYVVGYGESRPIANNQSAQGRAQNRRVEIEILPQQ